MPSLARVNLRSILSSKPSANSALAVESTYLSREFSHPADVPSTTQRLAREAAGSGSPSDELVAAWDELMQSLRQQASHKVHLHIDCRGALSADDEHVQALDPQPTLRDFDPNRTGRVTITQFRQALDINGFRVSDLQVCALLFAIWGDGLKTTTPTFIGLL